MEEYLANATSTGIPNNSSGVEEHVGQKRTTYTHISYIQTKEHRSEGRYGKPVPDDAEKGEGRSTRGGSKPPRLPGAETLIMIHLHIGLGRGGRPTLPYAV